MEVTVEREIKVLHTVTRKQYRRGKKPYPKVSIIEDNGHISGLKRAGLYETEPVSYENQPMFINTCVSFYTDYDPHELLDFTQSVENSLHRERLVHWGPRTIDIDIIKFGEKVINDERLYRSSSKMEGARFRAASDVRALRL